MAFSIRFTEQEKNLAASSSRRASPFEKARRRSIKISAAIKKQRAAPINSLKTVILTKD